jgi:membrane protein YqaA with SNARE-associated domain
MATAPDTDPCPPDVGDAASGEPVDSHHSTPGVSTEPREFSMRRLLLDTVLFTIALVVVVAIAGYLFRDPLATAADWMIERFGLAGLFVGTFLADAFTLPIPPDVYLFIGIASGTAKIPTIVACSIATVAGGNLAYFVGPYVQKLPYLKDKLNDFRPKGEVLFKGYGIWAVAVAAMTPVPFSIVSWLAGIYRMPYSKYFAASLVRVPRIIGYYGLYALGWAPAITG